MPTFELECSPSTSPLDRSTRVVQSLARVLFMSLCSEMQLMLRCGSARRILKVYEKMTYVRGTSQADKTVEAFRNHTRSREMTRRAVSRTRQSHSTILNLVIKHSATALPLLSFNLSSHLPLASPSLSLPPCTAPLLLPVRLRPLTRRPARRCASASPLAPVLAV